MHHLSAGLRLLPGAAGEVFRFLRVVAHLIDRGAASVKVGVLLRKTGRQEVPFEPDYVGFTIPDKFVVGYGLDFNDEYRHLPFIGVLPSGE